MGRRGATHEVLVIGVEELGPRLARVPAEDAVKVRIELEIVLVEIVEELVGAEHLTRSQARSRKRDRARECGGRERARA